MGKKIYFFLYIRWIFLYGIDAGVVVLRICVAINCRCIDLKAFI